MRQALEWIVLGCLSVLAIVAGVRWHRPARIGPWLLLAGSIAAICAGDVLWALDRRDTAELCYLAMFVLVASGLLQLTRIGAVLVDRARLIDMLAFTCSALLVVWVFVVGDSGMIGQVSAADIIGDLLLVAVAVRLIVAAWKNWAAILLGVGAVGMLTSDLVFPLAEGPLTEAGYVVLYLAWGAAALHPSMARLTEPAPMRPTPWRGRWAALLGASVATPPLVLLIESLNAGPVKDGVVISVAGGLTLMLTITRLADSVRLNSQALTRERALREATAALVSAADLPAVDTAVRAAIGQLMPPDAVTDVVFATDDRQLVSASIAVESPPDSARSWWDGDTLICPLWLEPLAVARPSGGALVITGRRDVLIAAQDTLDVLAGQAALALDRISLVEAVGRRDSDLYLRAVIRNTADAMLVIDEDQRIRYASPSLRDLAGRTELPALATLLDLVNPADRTQVREALQTEGDGVLFCALDRPDDTQVLVEVTYRDLREDRLVQGFVVTVRDVTNARTPDEQQPHMEHLDDLPAWVNRRSASHKFRY